MKMCIIHLESVGTKTSKNVHDVRKVVQGVTSVPYPIWIAFRCWKMIEIGVRVFNMCLSRFMVETSGYDSSWNNQVPLKRTFTSGVKHCLGSVHPWKRTDSACVDRWGVDANHRKNIDNLLEDLTWTVSDQINVCVARRRDKSLTHRWTVDRA